MQNTKIFYLLIFTIDIWKTGVKLLVWFVTSYKMINNWPELSSEKLEDNIN